MSFRLYKNSIPNLRKKIIAREIVEFVETPDFEDPIRSSFSKLLEYGYSWKKKSRLKKEYS